MYPEIISFTDWDIFKKPFFFSKIEDNDNLPHGNKKIVLKRDSNYNLKGTLFFQDKDDFLKKFFNRSDIAGEFDDGFEIIAKYLNGDASIRLQSCRLRGFSITGNRDYIGKANLHFDQVSINFSDKPPVRLREWYLNGPKYSSIESKDEVLLHQCSKEQFFSKENLDPKKYQGEHSFSHCYLWGKNADFKFLLAKAPVKELQWSNNIQIEYHKDWGKIPDKDERLKIEELCSFVFGKHLLRIGYTTYDNNENVIEVSAHSPWSENARALSLQPEYPPVRINVFPPGDMEKIINNLLPSYTQLGRSLCLHEALWNYWLSYDTPPGTNLPIIASAIETIINNWYKSQKTKSHGLYLPPSLFADLLKGPLFELTKSFSIVNNGQKVLDNISRANEFGIMERYRIFFEEIGLVINKLEWEAIKERSNFVHGHVHFDETDWKKVILQVNTLHTLFNKIFLKILGYQGDYIDRSSKGWPNSQLDKTTPS